MLVVAALGAVQVTGAFAAAGDSVRCGDIIMQDTKLDADLLDCPGDGLIIGADGVTLDLGGHVIDGDGDPDFAFDAGVRSQGHDRVQVTRGTVREFDSGVVLQRGEHHLVRALAAQDNVSVGIALFGTTDSTIDESAATGNRLGIGLREADHNEVVDNRVSANRQGIELTAGSSDNLVARNRVVANEYPALPSLGFGIGLGLIGRGGNLGDDRNRIVKNVVIANGGDGILIGSSTDAGNLLEHNRTNGNARNGITVRCLNSACNPSTSTLTKNTANDNGQLGIEAAVGVRDGGGNRARGNGDPNQCLNVACRPTPIGTDG